MTVLHVFDMDGTLLRDTTASLEIAKALGRVPELLELEQTFTAGGLTTYEFAVAAYELYRGLDPGSLVALFEGSPWIAGIGRVTADIRRRGERAMVITMSPNFFADLLLGEGIDEVHASRFPALPLRTLPEPSAILTPTDKVTIVDDALARHGCPPGRCVAYGDSASDIPLFAHLPHSVAVNATAALRRLATVSVESEDLWDAYRAGRTLLEPVPQKENAQW